MDQTTDWRIGQTSARYESGGRGPGTISSGRDDAGGVSYGQYQLSSAKGTVAEYLAWSEYGKQFEGLEINSTAFKSHWVELASSDPAFGSDQHAFIKTRHFDVQMRAMAQHGLDLSNRGPAVQDAIWSTSVQYRGFTPGIFQKALDGEFGKGADLTQVTDKQIVEAVQDYKAKTVETYFASSPNLWDSLRARAESEKHSLSEFAETGIPGSLVPHKAASPVSHHGAVLNLGDRGKSVTALQEDLDRLGYLTASGEHLTADGNFGSRTKQAVEAFQRSSRLTADGIVGHATEKALSDQLDASKRLDDPSHADFKLFAQARSHISDIDRSLGRSPDQHTENLASALVVQARSDGLCRIDQVALSTDGQKLWAVQMPPGRTDHLFDLRTNVATAEAMTPLEQSSAKWPQAMQQFEGHQQAAAQSQQQALDRQQQEALQGLGRIR